MPGTEPWSNGNPYLVLYVGCRKQNLIIIMPGLRLILGDQLSHKISVLKDLKDDDVVLMAEVIEKTQPVNHHKKKIAFIYSSMRHFAGELNTKGVNVRYIKHDESKHYAGIVDVIRSCLDEKFFNEIVVTEPGEYWLLDAIKKLKKSSNIRLQILPDNRFISTQQEFNDWAKNRSKLVMEYWYREMRKKTGLLMEDSKPVGGQWNFDRENRKRLKPGQMIKPLRKFRADDITLAVLQNVEKNFPQNFGEIQPFWYAVTATQARKALAHFIKYHLCAFGDYQDAMLTGEAFLFHSVISQYLNCGLLDPLETCFEVEKAYYRGEAPINAAEGFIRQIIGWREYIRGIYWSYMPEYKDRNVLRARRPLPGFYWDGNTEMNCISRVVKLTQKYAYSHHIQRLMITGNFANLAGIDVQQVCDWYLGVYADAFEWVELPNTLGMALYADGGTVGSKPYISTGNYIKRMSNYCDTCVYKPNERVGEKACPFTTLYWDYLIRHEVRFRKNQRMTIAYRNLDRISISEKKQIQGQAEKFFNSL
jgi:deoxyribodipyrimidine photolyase-related protein